MKCFYCGQTLDDVAVFSKSVTECPYCHKPVVRLDSSGEKTFSSILTLIVQTNGIELLEDGKKLTAFFSDYAPSMSREKRLLRLLSECKGNAILLNAVPKGPASVYVGVEQLVNKLTSEYSLAENAAREVCTAFLDAIYSFNTKSESSDSFSSSGENNNCNQIEYAERGPIAQEEPAPKRDPITWSTEYLVNEIKTLNLNANTSWKLYYPGDVGFSKLLGQAMRSYFPDNLKVDEEPLVLFDYTIFGTAKEGFVLTTERIVSKSIGSKVNIPFEQLIGFVDSKKSITITYFHKGGAVGSFILASADSEKDAKDFCNKINHFLYLIMGDVYTDNLDRAIGSLEKEEIQLFFSSL